MITIQEYEDIYSEDLTDDEIDRIRDMIIEKGTPIKDIDF